MHFFNFFGGHGGEMGKVKAQMFRGNQRAALLNMVAEDLPQRRLEEVGGSVIASDITPTFNIHHGFDCITDSQSALNDLTIM